MNRRLFLTNSIISLLAGPLAFSQSDDRDFLAKFEKTFEPGGNVTAKDFVPDG